MPARTSGRWQVCWRPAQVWGSVTPGSFMSEARREACRDGVPAIELIDGIKLIEMLETLQLGLIPRQTFEADERFFRDFRS